MNVEKFNNVPSLCFAKILSFVFQICWLMAHRSFLKVKSFCFGFVIW